MTAFPAASARLDTGDSAWLLAASALVLLMARGLALFYGGMVRSKSVLNMIMMSFVVLVHAFLVSGIIGLAVDRLRGFRVDEGHEIGGIDLVVHAETTYDLRASAVARSGGTGVLDVRIREIDSNTEGLG